MVRTRGLHHIHLAVRDLERSLRFYEQVFGMKELFRAGPHMVFLTTPGAEDLITLNGGPEERDKAGQSAGIAHFGFRLVDARDMDAAVREVERAGGKLLDRGEHVPGEPFAYLSDPDGYTIELGAQTILDRA